MDQIEYEFGYFGYSKNSGNLDAPNQVTNSDCM